MAWESICPDTAESESNDKPDNLLSLPYDVSDNSDDAIFMDEVFDLPSFM